MALDDVTVTVDGLDELHETLIGLPAAIAEKALKDAVRAGAEVFQGEIERSAPIRSGALAVSATYRVSGGEYIDQALAIIGIKYRGLIAASSRRRGRKPSTEDPGVYAKWVEYGRPGSHGHTHQAAQPFMRSAVNAGYERAFFEFSRALERGLARAVKKLNKKAAA